MTNNGADVEFFNNFRELNALFVALDDLVLIRDATGRCQKIFTPNAQHLLDPPVEALLGRSLHESLPADVANVLLQAIQEALETQQLVKREYRLTIGDRTCWFDTRLSPLTNQLVLFRIQDVTDRKQRELAFTQSETKLQAILDRASVALINFCLFPNGQTERRYYSTGCEDIYGFTSNQLITQPDLWRSRVHPDDWHQILVPAIRQLMVQPSLNVEYRFYHGDGSLRWLSETATATWDEQRQCWDVIVVANDVSDRRTLEAEREKTLATLQEKEARLGLTLSLNNIGQWDWDPISGVITWDHQFAHLFGLAPATSPNYDAWRACIHPDDVAGVEQSLQTMLTTQHDIRNEYRVVHPDGSIHWIAGLGARLDSTTDYSHFTGIVVDISDRKLAELTLQQINTELNRRVRAQTEELQIFQAQLQRRKKELHSLLENNPDVITRFDRNLRYVYANTAIQQATGLQPQEFIGKRPNELPIPADFADFWMAQVQHVLDRGQEHVIYFSYPTPEGIRHFEGKLVPEFSDRGTAETNLIETDTLETVLIISRDITRLKEIEAALRESEERFRKLFEASPIAIGLCKKADGYVYQVNPAYCRLVGYSEAELLSMSFVEYTHPDDVQLDLDHVHQLLSGQLSSFQIEKRFIHKQGTIYWVKLTATLLQNYENGVNYSMAMMEDITQQKQAEAALRLSEERFRSFFDHAPQPFSLADIRTRRFLRVNATYQTWLGYSYEELYSKTFLDITYPDDVDSDRRLSERMQSGELTQFQAQKRVVKKSGDVVWMDMMVTLIRDNDGQPLYSLCLCQDITQSKQLTAARDLAEATLRQQAQRDQLLRSITQHIHQSLNLDDILTITVAEVRQTLAADRALILHLHPDGEVRVVKESVVNNYPMTSHTWTNLCISPECHQLYIQGNPRIVLDLMEDECSVRPVTYLQSMGTQTKVTAPILQINEQGTILWGLLIVHACASKREWQPDEADLLQQIANQLAIALQQATLYQQVQNDLEERQHTETNLWRLLEEKEILLKEVHHRVKNNLQIISSLLRMQSRLLDTHTAQLFQEAQNRVQSIAVIHEHLYQSTDLAHINFEEYVQILVNNLLRSYGVNPQQVKITLDIQPMPLDLNIAIAGGLIINELVSNSLKYAFRDVVCGEITICLNSSTDFDASQLKRALLVVEDNGIGIPAELNWQTSRSLGLRIVRTLVDQIHGTITLERDRGTTFYINFPITTF